MLSPHEIPEAVGNVPALQAAARETRMLLRSLFLNWLPELGAQLGLFQAIAEHGPMTVRELATVAAIRQRCAREWLREMVRERRLKYYPTTHRFGFPARHPHPR